MTSRKAPAPKARKPKDGAADSAAPYHIDLRFLGGLTTNQRAAFDKAAKRWSKVIVNNLPAVQLGGDNIDGCLIEARGATIDGEGSILGQAGPTVLRPGSFLPLKGSMEFDTSDLAQMENEGTLVDVITHEMGHVLGIGTVWDRLGLLKAAGTANPRFTGAAAMKEFGKLLGGNASTEVSVENTGGPGTADSHWRERVFGNELMTGFVADAGNPLSRMTIGSLQDMGYTVNFSGAEVYALPSSLELVMMGIQADKPHRHQCSFCAGRRGLEPIVLPHASLLTARPAVVGGARGAVNQCLRANANSNAPFNDATLIGNIVDDPDDVASCLNHGFLRNGSDTFDNGEIQDSWTVLRLIGETENKE